MQTATVSPKFQVVIPKEIRKQLGLKPGQKLHVFIYNNRIQMIPELNIKLMKGFLKGIDTSVEKETL